MTGPTIDTVDSTSSFDPTVNEEDELWAGPQEWAGDGLWGASLDDTKLSTGNPTITNIR